MKEDRCQPVDYDPHHTSIPKPAGFLQKNVENWWQVWKVHIYHIATAPWLQQVEAFH